MYIIRFSHINQDSRLFVLFALLEIKKIFSKARLEYVMQFLRFILGKETLHKISSVELKISYVRIERKKS